jgi:aminomethyltransferase
LKKNIGYAMLPVEHAELGTELSVAVPDSVERKATVVPRPFVDPDKDIPKN